MTLLVLYLTLLKATALSFSGFASVPVLREDLVVARGVLTDEQLNSAIAISQASPGPLGLYLVAVGYFVAGFAGAIAGALALASPAFLAVPIAWIVRRGSDRYLRRAYSAIVIGSCALMLTTALQLAPAAVPSGGLVLLAAASFLLLTRTALPPIVVILICAVAVHVLP